MNMADVLDLAVNQYLWDGRSDRLIRRVQIFSCSAIAIANANKRKDSETEKIMDFLQSIGLDTESTQAFRSVPYGEKRQYARALWLTWAAMIAREEGKTL